MSTYITDASGRGTRLHVKCDKCGVEVVVPLDEHGQPSSEAHELIGWRRGIAQRDVCPKCQTKPDLPTLGKL
jgi:hypothetical protein